MLPYAVYTELRERLGRAADLSRVLLRGTGGFSDAVVRYLSEFLDLADRARLYIACDVSTALNKILTFRPNACEGAGAGRHAARKERDACAADALEALIGEIKRSLEKDGKTFEECTDVWRQVVARMLTGGMLPDRTDAPDLAAAIESAVAADPELAPYLAHIRGLAGSLNARALLESVLPDLGL